MINLADQLSKLRIAMFAGVFALVNNATTTPAGAQSVACLQLQNQLSAINSGGVKRSQPSPRAREFDSAIKKQRAQITKTNRIAKRNWCGKTLFNKRKSPACAKILSRLGKMKSNLSALQKKRKRLAPNKPQDTKARRRGIIRAMNRRNCLANNANAIVSAVPRNRSLTRQIFGVENSTTGQKKPSFRDTFRTMCVRKNDGYYFPVSFSTTPDHFDDDELTCQASCPNRDVALYYYAIPGQNSEDMISYPGKTPYIELSTAFAYRKQFSSEASCRYKSSNLREVAGSAGETDEREDASGINLALLGKPVFRRDRGLDPESFSNLDGSFDDEAIKGLLSVPQNKSNAQIAALKGRKIRVVGPAFYPAQ